MDNRRAQTNIAEQVAILATVANEKEQHWITGGHGRIPLKNGPPWPIKRNKFGNRWALNKTPEHVATLATVADEEEQNWITGGH